MEINLLDVIYQTVEQKKAENKAPAVMMYKEIVNHVMMAMKQELTGLKENGMITLREGINDWMVGINEEEDGE